MDPPRTAPPRALNRWSLEPLTFLMPVLVTLLSVFAYALVVLGPGGYAGLAIVILVFALVLASTVASLRRKRGSR